MLRMENERIGLTFKLLGLGYFWAANHSCFVECMKYLTPHKQNRLYLQLYKSGVTV